MARLMKNISIEILKGMPATLQSASVCIQILLWDKMFTKIRLFKNAHWIYESWIWVRMLKAKSDGEVDQDDEFIVNNYAGKSGNFIESKTGWR